MWKLMCLPKWKGLGNIFLLIYLFFWLHRTACGILVPQPGMQPAPPEVEVWSLNRWTTRETPIFLFTFEEFQSWQKKILAHYFLSSASSEETCISLPHSAFLVNPKDHWVSKTNNPKNQTEPKQTLPHFTSLPLISPLHNLPHRSPRTNCALSRYLSLLYLIYTCRKWTFPW